jgi:hypothetical protein
VRRLLSALVYNGKAAHGSHEDVTRQMGASSYRERPKGLYEQNRFAMGPSGWLNLGEDPGRPGFQNRGKARRVGFIFACSEDGPATAQALRRP